jgi:hypothetical protein
VATVLVVIHEVRTNQLSEVLVAEDDDMLEQFALTAPDPALGEWILPGAPIARAHGLGAQRLHESHHSGAEDGVPVEDEMLRRGVERERFWITDAEVGWKVTLKWRTRRLPCSMTNRT